MTEITPTALTQYQIDERPIEQKKNELGQNEFLELMLTQLKNQDPFKPMENGEFLGQMAQFSTVSGIEKMQTSLDQLALSYSSNQTLQATQLIGQDVLVNDHTVHLDDKSEVSGRFELTSSSGSVTLTIADSTGQLIHQANLGEHGKGRHDFAWDGKNDKGVRVPAGQYSIEINSAAGDEILALPVMLNRRVDSVEFGARGDVVLNTADGSSLTLDQIREIKQPTVTN